MGYKRCTIRSINQLKFHPHQSPWISFYRLLKMFSTRADECLKFSKVFFWTFLCLNCTDGNGPRSIYQYSYMAPRLSGQTSIFGVVFFVSKSPLGIEGQKKLEKFTILTRKPRSHARILIYRTWPIASCSNRFKESVNYMLAIYSILITFKFFTE